MNPNRGPGTPSPRGSVDARIRRLSEDHWDQVSIAKHVGVSRSRVQRALGATFPSDQRPRKYPPPPGDLTADPDLHTRPVKDPDSRLRLRRSRDRRARLFLTKLQRGQLGILEGGLWEKDTYSEYLNCARAKTAGMEPVAAARARRQSDEQAMLLLVAFTKYVRQVFRDAEGLVVPGIPLWRQFRAANEKHLKQ